VGSPLIAIPAYPLRPGQVARWGDRSAYAIPTAYIEALRRAGARAALLVPGDRAEPAEVLAPFDGLLLAGGGDVDPARYGAEPHPAIYGVEPERDELEIALTRAAIASGFPTLAICRGAQLVNVALGGTLVQHLPDANGGLHHGSPGDGGPVMHDVRIAPDSRLADACGGERLLCSSHHHQGIDTIGDGLVPTAWSDDGLVEGFEGGNGWLVAVQWHPEDTAADDPAQQSLFDAFVAEARA